MPLTAEQQQRRAFKVTASMMPIIMSSNAEMMQRLYLEAIGDAEREPSNWAMQLGSLIEPLILDYWQTKTNLRITRRGEVVDHPTIRNACATLDGWRAADNTVIETKFLSPWRDKDEFYQYFYPQVLFQLRCVGANRGILLVAQGTNEPVEHEVLPDADYEKVMWAQVAAFLLCMETLTPPIPIKAPIPAERWRTIDLTIDPDEQPLPNWAFGLIPALRLLEDTREAAELHQQAGIDAKSYVPDDVGTVITHEHRIARNKKGTLVVNRKAAA